MGRWMLRFDTFSMSEVLKGRPKRPTRIGLAPAKLSIDRADGQPLSIDRQCVTVFQAAHCVSISHSTQRVGDVLKLLSGSRACKPPRLKTSYLNSGHGRETDLTSRDCRDLSAAMSNANRGVTGLGTRKSRIPNPTDTLGP